MLCWELKLCFPLFVDQFPHFRLSQKDGEGVLFNMGPDLALAHRSYFTTNTSIKSHYFNSQAELPLIEIHHFNVFKETPFEVKQTNHLCLFGQPQLHWMLLQ